MATELKRVLGFWTILALSIGSIIGTGIFFGASTGSQYSGNASLIAWVVLSILAIYISMYFAELVSMYPKAGGVYEFSKHAYSRFISFLVGWIAWLVSNLSTALLVVSAIDYLLPGQSNIYLKIGISVVLIIVLNIIAFFGIEASAFVLILLTAITLGVLVALIVPGAFQVDTSNFLPIEIAGASSLLITLFYLAESFFGWESATYLAEETQEPEKVIPKAIVLGTVIVALLAISIAVVSLGIIPWQVLAKSSVPLALVSKEILGNFGRQVINIGIFISLIGAAAGGIITMPRLILALARDKLFISQFSSIHPKYKTPHKAIIFQTIVTLIVFAMAFGKYHDLLSLMLPLGFILYFFVVLCVVILRSKEPFVKRTFKVPFVTLGSMVVVTFILGVLWAWLFPNFDSAINFESLKILQLGISLVFVGIPIYLLLEIYYNPDTIIKLNDWLAYLTLIMERFILPKSIRKEVLALLGDIRGKKILEFGCSVGTLTMHLAEEVRPNGKIYATDLSIRDLMITKRRLEKRGHNHVTVIHDEHQINRVHPSVPHVDSIVSIGMMGYLQDVKKVLKEMRDLLPYGGKIVFVDYADFFKIIPNVAWLSNDKTVEKMFREAGFSVFVTRKKGILWNYVYVYGIKFHENVPYI